MNNNINQLGQNIVDNTSSKAKLTDKSQNTLFWLGGFVEGEGSNGVSVAVNRSFKYGINLQPMFSVTQHVRGIAILNAFKEVLGCGSVVAKSGSPNIWAYYIKGYKQIIKTVLPFLEGYVQPFSCKTEEFNCFKTLVLMSAAGGQKDKDTLIEMVKLAYTVQGKGKARTRSLAEVLSIIEDKNAYFDEIERLKAAKIGSKR